MAKTVIAVRDIPAPGSTITLPTWTDPTSIVVFLTALLATANTVITLVSPGFTYPVAVTASVAPVSLLIAVGVIIANIVRHSKATVAAITR